jgi:hypothetical protein
VLQAWGAYGVLWPVVHQQLGVDPDLGHGRLTVVPQLPPGQRHIAGADIRLGSGAGGAGDTGAGGSVDVAATLSGRSLRIDVNARLACRLSMGAVLPAGAAVAGVRLDGHPVEYRVVTTARGTEVHVDTGSGRHTLVVDLR